MTEKIVVPALGESITEATITKWLKSKGETVNSDEPVVELETDKVNVEVPSPVTGVITEINSKDGETVQVGAVLGTISETEEKNVTQKIEKIKPRKKPTENELSQKDEEKIKIFTTRPDTIFGASFIALSIDHAISKNFENNKDFQKFKLNKIRPLQKIDSIIFYCMSRCRTNAGH